MEKQYIAPLAECVNRTHVKYQNRYGMDIAGDLYMARTIDNAVRFKVLSVLSIYKRSVYSNSVKRARCRTSFN